MQYGICNLGIVPLRFEPLESGEMVSQALYGDYFKVLEKRGKWSRIRVAFDSYEGWIANNQYLQIDAEDYANFDSQSPNFSADLVDFVADEKQNLMAIPLGSALNSVTFLGHTHDGNKVKGRNKKENILNTAFLYLNAPFLWGGKSPFGIDSSGFTQMVYRINGYNLFRDASQQATQGESLSFIEESEPGDLVFFDDNEGQINHAGIIMTDNYIIHSFGKVRIDRIDHSGIYNAELRRHTHKLRVIKKIF